MKRSAGIGTWHALAPCLATIACAVGAIGPAVASATPSPGTGLATVRPACQARSPHEASCFALIRTPVASTSAQGATASPFVVDSGASSPGPAGGLTPAQLASAYGYEPESGGTGQTVGIVDAFDDPDIEGDLATFDARYGLPACTTANGCFRKVGQTGSASALPPADTTGWSVEISLDVEAVHAACSKCKILLVEAENPLVESLAAGVNEAVALGATVVSNGYGAPESVFGASRRGGLQPPWRADPGCRG